MPTVSVIIPTFNRANSIAESIQSVLDQTFQNYEIIIVDDGSTDNTREVVESFQDLRIKYLYQENQGVVGAQNTGIHASKGDYIALLGSDDTFLNNSLEKRVRVLEKYPEVALCFGQAYMMDERGRIYSLHKPAKRDPGIWRSPKEIINLIIYGNYILASTAIIRRSYVSEVGVFNPTFNSGSEDFEFFVRLAKKYTLYYLDEPLARYRIHRNSITGSRRLYDYRKKQITIIEGIFNDPEIGTHVYPMRPWAYLNLYLRLAHLAYWREEMKASRKYLYKTLTIHPRGFLKDLWPPWLILFAKTLIPPKVIRSFPRGKYYMNVACKRRFHQ